MPDTDVLSKDDDVLSAGYVPDPSEKLEIERQQAATKQSETLLKRAEAQTQKVQEAADKEAAVAAAREKDMQAPLAAAQKASQGVSDAAKQGRPQLEKVPAAPQKAAPDETWLSLAGIIGATAGALTRQHATNALAAFTGVINGLSERDEAKFQASMKTWEAENKRVIETNKQRLEDYHDTIDNAKLDFEQKVNELKLKSQYWDDKAMSAASQTKNQKMIGDMIDYQMKVQDQYITNSQRLIDQKERFTRNQFEYKQRQLRNLAQEEVDRTPQITEAMMRGEIQGPSRTPRDNMAGWVDRIRMATLADRGYKADAYDTLRAGDISEARVQGAAAANIDIVLRSAEPALRNAAEAASRFPATGFPDLNKLIQRGAQIVGDPALKNLQLSTLEVTEALAKAMNPRSSIVAVANMQRAAEYVSTADSPEAYTAMLRNVARFINREQQAIRNAREHKPMEEIVIEDIPRTMHPIPRELLPKTQGLTPEGKETSMYILDRGLLMQGAKEWLTAPAGKPASPDTTRTLPLTTAPPGGA